jgi:hypothetical protein
MLNYYYGLSSFILPTLEDAGGKTVLDFLSNLSSSNKEVSLEWEHHTGNVPQ